MKLSSLQKGLVGHWPLDRESLQSATTFADKTPNENRGISANAPVFTTDRMGQADRAMSFDGSSDYIDVIDDSSLDFGTGEFALSAWVHTGTNLIDTVGDVLNKFDQSNKKGFNFNIKSNAGSAGSQSSFRQLSFGIDNNHPGAIWTQVAPKLGSETHLYSLAVYNGKLYGGTIPNGNLYEWNGINAWVQVAPKLGSETHIYSLAVYNGKLYGGTYPNGKLYEWNGINAWVQVAPKLGSETHISSLAVYNGKLYGGTYPNGNLYEWNGINAWVQVAPKLGSETYIFSLAVYNGKLYGGTYPNGNLYEWNGINAWVQVAPKLGSETHIYSLAVYNGKLYGGTYPNGKLYEWNGINAWVQVAPKLGSETYIFSLAVYNGKLYGGTYPNGKLYEWNGINAWVQVAPKLGSETHIYSLAVYNGKLYGGTFPNGKLYEWKTGKVVTYDYELESGWKHIVAIKDNTTRTLKLFIDGVKVAESEQFVIADFDISNAENLLIGFGIQDYFNGDMADVRVVNRVPSQQEITSLYNQYRLKLSLGTLQKGLVLDMPLTSKRYNAGNTKFDDLTPYENRGTNTGGDVDTDHTTFIAANSDNVRIPDSESLSPINAMTAMTWVKGVVQNSKGVFSHWDLGVIQRSFLAISNNNKLGIYISDDGSTNVGHYKAYRSDIAAFDSAYHLIGFTFNAGTLKLFIDGVEDTNLTKMHDDAITTIHNSTADVMLGCHLNSDTPMDFFNGDLAKPKIWNRALSAEEWLLAYDQTKGLYL